MRIAALEQNSAETEKIIAEARTERLKHLDEVYRANRRAAELEAQWVTLSDDAPARPTLCMQPQHQHFHFHFSIFSYGQLYYVTVIYSYKSNDYSPFLPNHLYFAKKSGLFSL